MSNAQFEELAGRIEGLASFALALTAALEINGLIDGIQFAGDIGDMAKYRTVHNRPECTAAARRMLNGLTDELNGMRQIRQ